MSVERAGSVNSPRRSEDVKKPRKRTFDTESSG